MPANNTAKGTITLLDDKFTVIDDKARYIIKGGKMYIEIELPQDPKDLISEEGLSSSFKTFRLYTNGTNRKFIKNSGLHDVQMQINSYVSVKDASKMKDLSEEHISIIASAEERQKK
ncbi:MAG: hypothetical protein ACFFG0_53535 [Candidatus Thorarchaeota archaeon]